MELEQHVFVQVESSLWFGGFSLVKGTYSTSMVGRPWPVRESHI